MENKSSKTIWIIVIAVLLFAGAMYVLAHLWEFVIGGVVGLIFGYYFGYSKGKEKKKL
ncbi:MAG: hypothetical protein HYZ14_08445 [Bacteroidetes bacterium]|nr:hypothetical protein [Bacteroidota bacterium]